MLACRQLYLFFCLSLVQLSLGLSSDRRILQIEADEDVTNAFEGLMNGIKELFPRSSLNINMSNPEFDVTMFQDYGMSLLPAVAPAMAIAAISLLASLVYIPIRSVMLCCGGSKRPRYQNYGALNKWTPVGVDGLLAVFVLMGCVVGMVGNSGISGGLSSIASTSLGVGDTVLDLGDQFTGYLANSSALFPTMVTTLEDEVMGLPETSRDLNLLSSNLTDMAADVTNVSIRMVLLGGSTPEVQALVVDVANVASQSTNALNEVSTLVGEIDNEVWAITNSTLSTMNDILGGLGDTTDQLQSIAENALEGVAEYVDMAHEYVDMGLGYDRYRRDGMFVVLALPIAWIVLMTLGIAFKKTAVLHIASMVGIVLLFIFFFFGGLHFALSFILTDGCGFLSGFSLPPPADQMLAGCENGSTIFTLMGFGNPFNLSELFSYDGVLENFDEFMNETSSFGVIDSYLNSSMVFLNYNLTAEAEQVTPADVGFPNKTVQGLIDEVVMRLVYLNSLLSVVCTNDTANMTSTSESLPFSDFSASSTFANCNPGPFYETNYTSIQLVDYPIRAQFDIQMAIVATYSAIVDRDLITARVADYRQNLTEIQGTLDQIEARVSAMTLVHESLKDRLDTFQQDNITTIFGLVDEADSLVTNFFQLGECGFVSDAYDAILSSLCADMVGALDLTSLGLFIVGFFLLCMILMFVWIFPRFRARSRRIMPVDSDTELGVLEDKKHCQKSGKSGVDGGSVESKEENATEMESGGRIAYESSYTDRIGLQQPFPPPIQEPEQIIAPQNSPAMQFTPLGCSPYPPPSSPIPSAPPASDYPPPPPPGALESDSSHVPPSFPPTCPPDYEEGEEGGPRLSATIHLAPIAPRNSSSFKLQHDGAVEDTGSQEDLPSAADQMQREEDGNPPPLAV